MWQYLLGGAVVAIVAVQGIQYFELNSLSEPRDGSGISAQSSESQSVSATKTRSNNTVSYAGRTERIAMDNRGHFITTAKMNGRRVEVLVDTGATSVAINRSTARRLGISLKPSDFKYDVHTANGTTKAAAAMIDRVTIGRVSVENVRAAVLEDRALGETLLGMSFLGELRSFEVRNRELLLTQ